MGMLQGVRRDPATASPASGTLFCTLRQSVVAKRLGRSFTASSDQEDQSGGRSAWALVHYILAQTLKGIRLQQINGTLRSWLRSNAFGVIGPIANEFRSRPD